MWTGGLCGFGQALPRAPLSDAWGVCGGCLKFKPLANLVCVSHRCGKTTVCQLFAALTDQRLYSVSCHLHMETSDFLGGLRPARQKPDDKVCPEQVMMRLFI